MRFLVYSTQQYKHEYIVDAYSEENAVALVQRFYSEKGWTPVESSRWRVRPYSELYYLRLAEEPALIALKGGL